MCTHCREDMSRYDWAALAATTPDDDLNVAMFHDRWLFPHGRVGYNSTHEDIAAAERACPFCQPDRMSAWISRYNAGKDRA